MSFGASPGFDKRQSWLQDLLLDCFRLLSIFVEGNGGCITIYNGADGVWWTVMGGMPGRAACQKARCPALANANARLNMFSFSLSKFLKHFCGREWGVYYGLQCATWYAWRGDALNCAC